jgi:hypothetical protein
MADGATNTRKWWLEATYVTAISAAIIVPSVTLLDHWLDYTLEVTKQEHALRLAEQKQSHEIRQTYLDRAIDPHRTTEYRRSVLSFLSVTLDDKEPMKGWAEEELTRLVRAVEIEGKLASAEAQSKSLQQQLAQARASEGRNSRDAQGLVRDLKATEAKVTSLQKELESAKSQANIAPISPLPAENMNDSSDEAASNDRANSPGSKQASKRGGGCCITCNGATICASSVSTSCGSCGGGGGG